MSLNDRRGSIWRRWEPHIHTPETILEDQFSSEDPWEDYLSAIESSSPVIEVLGVTDYWSVDRYTDVRAYKESGRLSAVRLLFPNVEIRFAIGTDSGSPINAHLLISPDDPDHVLRAQRFLGSLTFRAHGEVFRCTSDDLKRLGMAHDTSISDEGKALETGANQFKITLDTLKEALESSDWAQRNVVIGVVAGTGDGTSGLQSDASLTTLRREIESLAHVIFSGRPGDREFWLGRRAMAVSELEATYGGPKPCLHGSDAHSLDRVGQPADDRFTWIKGDPTFESLWQACIEPDTRSFVGQSPPSGALPYQTIDSIALSNAPWCKTPEIPLNPGLVGIIGARGSGKTALADLIATAAQSPESENNDRSFLRRAASHLVDLETTLTWCDGAETAAVGGSAPTQADAPRVQYLSQQFVERLCSADGGMTAELLREIERVIYDEHPSDTRIGTTNFQELLSVKAGRARQARDRNREAIADAIEQLSQEREKDAALPELRNQHQAAEQALTSDKSARGALIVGGSTERTERLNQISTAIDERQLRLDSIERRKQALVSLRDSVDDFRARRAPSLRRELARAHADAGLTDEDWEQFDVQFVGDVDALIARYIDSVDGERTTMLGPPSPVDEIKTDTRYVADGAELGTVPLAALRNEAERLRKLIGIDDRKANQLRALDEKIARAEIALAQLGDRIKDAEGADARIDTLNNARRDAYGGIFDAFGEEEKELESLYAPLRATLDGSEGVLAKLTFSVRRDVDVAGWAEEGEDLLDLRTAGPFKGTGAVLEIARSELLDAWQRGSSADVSRAMAAFRDEHDKALLEHAPPAARASNSAFWEWGSTVATWLDSTDHVAIRYGVQYDGVDIEQLSPGNRGIVLLLLYLSIDRNDDRPLIIDQPEENLDPKSIFDELVERFRTTRMRRQVVIVTHNANLVVNTDADQVIVASAGSHRPGDLPEIQYTSGGLENPEVREEVCKILEGGERAFRERARRLRVDLR